MKLSERIRTCMTTPMTEFSVDGPKDKWTFQLIEEQLWVANKVAQLEVAAQESDQRFSDLQDENIILRQQVRRGYIYFFPRWIRKYLQEEEQ